MNKHFDIGSLTVVLITFLLFAFALFTKGLTHDILLEAGILLVSVKLIMMNYKTSLYYKSIQEDLKQIKETVNSCNQGLLNKGH